MLGNLNLEVNPDSLNVSFSNGGPEGGEDITFIIGLQRQREIKSSKLVSGSSENIDNRQRRMELKKLSHIKWNRRAQVTLSVQEKYEY
jgi:hypothetical protein